MSVIALINLKIILFLIKQEAEVKAFLSIYEY